MVSRIVYKYIDKYLRKMIIDSNEKGNAILPNSQTVCHILDLVKHTVPVLFD